MGQREQEIVDLIPRLRRYARALTGQADTADDLVLDCVERGLSRLHLWRAGSDLRAWLFTIMHNLHVNNVRRSRIRPDGAALPEWETTGSAPRQDDVVELNSIVAALKQLPDEQREVILLVGLEELSYREAAAVLDVPIGTVMSRLARGRDKLRQLTGGRDRVEAKA